MGYIIDRIRRRQQRVGPLTQAYLSLLEWEREQRAKAADRFLTSDGAPPGMLKFRRWAPPAWGTSSAELRQPEEQAKNEAMRQRVEDLPPNTLVSVNAEGTGYVGTEPPMSKQP